MEKIIEKFRTTRFFAGLGIGLLFLGVILPYAKVNVVGLIKTYNFIDSFGGIIILFLSFIILIFIYRDILEKYFPMFFKNKVFKYIKGVDYHLVLLPISIIVIISIYLTISMNMRGSSIRYSFGFLSLWLGLLFLIGYVLLYKRELDTTVEENLPGGLADVRVSLVSAPVEMTPEPALSIFNDATPIETFVTPVNTISPLKSAPVKYCVNCGHACAIEANNCIMCGANLK